MFKYKCAVGLFVNCHMTTLSLTDIKGYIKQRLKISANFLKAKLLVLCRQTPPSSNHRHLYHNEANPNNTMPRCFLPTARG